MIRTSRLGCGRLQSASRRLARLTLPDVGIGGNAGRFRYRQASAISFPAAYGSPVLYEAGRTLMSAASWIPCRRIGRGAGRCAVLPWIVRSARRAWLAPRCWARSAYGGAFIPLGEGGTLLFSGQVIAVAGDRIRSLCLQT